MRSTRTIPELALCILTVALCGGPAACSDSSDDDGSAASAGAANDDATDDTSDDATDDATDDDATTDTLTVAITADEGGTVEDEAGTVSLEIPAGALAENQDIALAVEAARDGSETSVYDFGPDGLTFETPVTLSIAFDGDVPDGKQAVLAVEEDGEWVAIEGSSASDGIVSGPITHFSSFTVILVDGDLVAVSECSERVANFAACGGELEGTWSLVELCFPPIDVGDSEASAQCPGMTVDVEYEATGTITFTADTVSVSEVQTSVGTVVHFPLTCLGSSQATCDMLNDDDTSCSQGADTCDCTQPSSTETEPASDAKPYTIDGNEAIVQEDEGPQSYPYCITGDQLEILMEDEGTDGTVTQFVEVLQRQ